MSIAHYLKAKRLKFFAVANERRTSLIRGNKLKRCGVTSGVSDLIIYSPGAHHSCLFLELKTEIGKLSPSQKEFGEDVNSNPQLSYVVAYGLDEAISAIEEYLGRV